MPWVKIVLRIVKRMQLEGHENQQLGSKAEPIKLTDCGVHELKKASRHSCRNRLTTILPLSLPNVSRKVPRKMFRTFLWWGFRTKSIRYTMNVSASITSRHQLMHLVQWLSVTAWDIIHGRIDSILHAIYLPLL